MTMDDSRAMFLFVLLAGIMIGGGVCSMLASRDRARCERETALHRKFRDLFLRYGTHEADCMVALLQGSMECVCGFRFARPHAADDAQGDEVYHGRA